MSNSQQSQMASGVRLVIVGVETDGEGYSISTDGKLQTIPPWDSETVAKIRDMDAFAMAAVSAGQLADTAVREMIQTRLAEVGGSHFNFNMHAFWESVHGHLPDFKPQPDPWRTYIIVLGQWANAGRFIDILSNKEIEIMGYWDPALLSKLKELGALNRIMQTASRIQETVIRQAVESTIAETATQGIQAIAASILDILPSSVIDKIGDIYKPSPNPWRGKNVEVVVF